MKNSVYIATSLDGYIARKDGSIDWLVSIPNPTESDYGFSEFMEGIDGIIMGRNTFETLLTFDEWPYAKKIFVLSNTLQSMSEHLQDRAEIVSGDLQQILKNLHARGIYNLYIDGGKTIQSFLKEDLIDELTITRASIILGDGIPLFGNSSKALEFKHIHTEVLNDMLVKSTFQRQR